METEVIGGRWGTWEELLLGGAVLRHGNHDWNVVAAELQARTLCTFTFTPSVCKSKYEDLQQRYSGSKTLFEELRKKRMAELRQALEVSEDSIGSLETKLETLKVDEGDHGHINCVSSQTESPLPFQKSKGIESSSKETSKDGLSAGSFTLETRTSWSSECQIPAAALAEEIETKLEALHSFEQDKVSIIEKLAENAYGRQGGTVKKRRGKRKRKDCSGDVKEGSVGESGLLDSTDAVTVSQCKESSASRKRKVCSRDVKEGSVGESGLLDSSVAVTVSQCKENSASRKRKDFSRDVKEGSVGESGVLDSTDAVTVFQCKENSASRKSKDVSRDVKEGSVGESGLLDSTDAVIVSKCKENSASRKDCSRNVKEGSVGESGLLDSTDAVTVSRCNENSADAVTVSRTKENSNGDCCEVSRSSGSNDQNGGSVKEGIDNLMRVFSSILEHKSASTFRHRLDSQKRGRYKKMIRRHMDFDTLRSRITSLSIMSVKEVFRDVLLLANNALVFYSKNTREHKSAMLLRDFTTKTLRQHFDHDSSSKAASPNLPPKTTMYNPPVKPRSIRHGNRKSPGMAAISENTVTNTSSNAGRTARDTYATLMESLAARKKGFGRPRKGGRKMKNQPSQTPAKGRKRGRNR